MALQPHAARIAVGCPWFGHAGAAADSCRCCRRQMRSGRSFSTSTRWQAAPMATGAPPPPPRHRRRRRRRRRRLCRRRRRRRATHPAPPAAARGGRSDCSSGGRARLSRAARRWRRAGPMVRPAWRRARCVSRRCGRRCFVSRLMNSHTVQINPFPPVLATWHLANRIFVAGP